MRTNIIIDQKLMERAMTLSGLPTKRAVVDEALKLYVQMLHQKALHQLRGQLSWEGYLEVSKTNV